MSSASEIRPAVGKVMHYLSYSQKSSLCVRGKRRLRELRRGSPEFCCDWCSLKVNAEAVKHMIAISVLTLAL